MGLPLALIWHRVPARNGAYIVPNSLQSKLDTAFSSTSRTPYFLHCKRLKPPELGHSSSAMAMLQAVCISDSITRKHQCAFTFDNADDLHGAPTSSTLSGTCYVLRRRSHHQDMTKTSFSVDDLDDHPGPSDDHGYRHRRQWPPPVIASPDSSDDLSPSFVRRRPL